MRLHVFHRTEYRFDQPQARLVQLLRLTPANHAGQSVIAWGIEVDRDARLRRQRDGYGNEVTMLYVDGPLDRIAIAVRGEVLTEDRGGVLGPMAERLPPLACLQSTPLTAADAGVHAIVKDLGPSGEPLAYAHRMCDAVHERLAPLPPSLDHDQRATRRLAEGSADPQGAAHVLIAAARAAAIPARYVAGHLYRPHAEDGHAAHGWAELHVEGHGWIGFDPFEGCCPGETHIRVAIGLDHAQAAPISGLRLGGGGESLAVDVHVGPHPAAQD